MIFDAFNVDDIHALDGALCYTGGYDPALWFGPDIEGKGYASYSVTRARVKSAKAICDQCPVRVKCLEIALKNDEREGVFGGLTPDERAELKRGAA